MNRLRSYREIEGINQEELGDKLDLSPSMVSAIEAGRRVFPGDLRVLGYSDDRLSIPPMSEPLHRHRASTAAAAKKRAKELLRLAGEVFGELCAITDKAPRWSMERRETPTSLDALEDIAVDVRAELLHDEFGPIRNLTAAVEQAGACIIPMVGVTGIDGISSWVDGVPVVGLSPAVPGDRFRFSLAHELGHLLLHHRKSSNTEPEANRFAGALLFPRAEFDAAMPDHPNLRDFIALKSAWGVAVAALVYRAHELGYVDDARYRGLQIQMSKWHKTEPATFEPAYGTLLGRLVEVNGGTSKVASRLGVNEAHLGELLNWRHLRAA